MRELIYVSEAKLQQLLPALPGRAGRLRNVDAEVKTPLGGVKISKTAQPHKHNLAAAVAALESSSRAPKWFADPDVRPGQWVHFEAPLSYGVVPGGWMVLFVDPNTPSADYPTGDLRLLLHGTSGHLVGFPGVDPNLRVSGSSWRSGILQRFLRELRAEEDPPDDSAAFDTGRPTSENTSHRGVRALVRSLSYTLETEHTAAWMAGYARTTAVYPKEQGANAVPVLTATPLYVEYIDPPGERSTTT